VLAPDGLSRFDETRRREAARAAILYAFDLIKHDGHDLRDLPFLDRMAALVGGQRSFRGRPSARSGPGAA
jgi:ATP-dependent DNA ligase